MSGEWRFNITYMGRNYPLLIWEEGNFSHYKLLRHHEIKASKTLIPMIKEVCRQSAILLFSRIQTFYTTTNKKQDFSSQWLQIFNFRIRSVYVCSGEINEAVYQGSIIVVICLTRMACWKRTRPGTSPRQFYLHFSKRKYMLCHFPRHRGMFLKASDIKSTQICRDPDRKQKHATSAKPIN